MRDLLNPVAQQKTGVVISGGGGGEFQLLPPAFDGRRYQILAIQISVRGDEPGPPVANAAFAIRDDNSDCPVFLNTVVEQGSAWLFDGGFRTYEPGEATPDIAVGDLTIGYESTLPGTFLFWVAYMLIN